MHNCELNLPKEPHTRTAPPYSGNIVQIFPAPVGKLMFRYLLLLLLTKWAYFLGLILMCNCALTLWAEYRQNA